MNNSRKVVLLEGDGIGPEITEVVLQILDAAGARIEWLPASAGQSAVDRCGESLPQETIEIIRATSVALKGPIGTPIGRSGTGEGKGFRSVNVGLRQALELYANFRPALSLPGVKSRYAEVDIVFIRENTEGLYSGLELEVVPGVVTSLKVATKTACTRIAEFAFAYAERVGRKKVTAVHKANIMKLSDGLALDCYREVANQHPTIEYQERIIDATAMALVMDPSQFDVLLMENLYGDILSDLGAGLVGGLGLAPSVNFGQHGAVFEAVHGSAPDIAGKGIANPSALLLSAVELLDYIGQSSVGSRVRKSLLSVLAEQRVVTVDLKGTASTKEFAAEIIRQLDE